MTREKRKIIQKNRMWHYFVDAAVEIIETEGIDKITIRKVADKAGFTSSTVYNYFDELSHLVFFAAMRFTKDYIEDLPNYLDKGSNTIEKWMYSWECFCKYTFERPKIYSLIFINNLGSAPKDLLDHYYEVYKDDLLGLPEEIQLIILEHTIPIRSALFLKLAEENEEIIKTEDIEFISDVTFFIWKGMMTTVLNNRRKYTTEEAINKTLSYIYKSVMLIVDEDKREKINFKPNYKLGERILNNR